MLPRGAIDKIYSYNNNTKHTRTYLTKCPQRGAKQLATHDGLPLGLQSSLSLFSELPPSGRLHIHSLLGGQSLFLKCFPIILPASGRLWSYSDGIILSFYSSCHADILGLEGGPVTMASKEVGRLEGVQSILLRGTT